jgi:twitching motility protein PilT
LGASDVHLKSGLPPVFRIKGDLRTLRDTPPLTAEVIGTFAVNLMTDKQRQHFEEHHDADLSYGTADGVRYRVNVFRQRGQTGMVMRLIPPDVPGFDRLNLPPAVQKLCEEERGLILVTGITGSGKSTTLAAMLNHINNARPTHIMTVEDPIEYLHRDNKSIINQREIRTDTGSFSLALRSALRQDPDVILVGEMRDLETVETALLAAETGHLVFSTLHTLDAPESINRIVAVFPPHQQRQVRLQLAAILKAVVSQRLMPRANGQGRIAAVEVMTATPFIRDCILDKDKTHSILGAIAAGTSQYGMQTFDQSIFGHYKRGAVSYDDALRYATNQDEFKLRVQGIATTSEMARQEMHESSGAEVEISRFGG